ncbi:MAG: hypothetical protein M1819_006176 [Sarea resinae]|nr:MAG: hypothetical protein M1819_006176 [Sarea resinae]
MLISTILNYWPLAILLAVAVHLVGNRFSRGLNKYPGPFLASLTGWWRFFDVLGRRPDITHIKLHKELGDIVRLGPNCLSFANPKALKSIYGLNQGYVKSGFYPVQQGVSRGKILPSLFSTTDESYHAQFRRSVNGAFSMSQVVQYEPLVDSTIEVFLNRTDELFAKTGATCDFMRWLQYFAADVVGELTYSKRVGYLENNEDVGGLMKALNSLFNYAAPVGQMPFLDRLLAKNPLMLLLDKYGLLSITPLQPIAKFARARMAERTTPSEKQNGSLTSTRHKDLLSKFYQAKADRPEFMNDDRVLTMALSMTFAGSDTTYATRYLPAATSANL